MAFTFADLVGHMRALFGSQENSSGDLQTQLGRLAEGHSVYEWQEMQGTAANQHVRRDAQTVSLSASQPLAERVVYIADHKEKVKSIHFAPFVSATTTATATMAWHLLVTKRGGSFATASGTNTYSLTAFVAGVSSDTSKHGTASHSFSALTTNLAHAPNRCNLSDSGDGFGNLDNDQGAIQLGKGDVLTAQVLKGSGTASDSGAIFRGGTLKIVTEKN